MEHVQTLQNIQFGILAIIALAIAVQLVRVFVNYRVHRQVYGKGLQKYIQSKVLEKEFKLNKSRDLE